MKKRCACSAKCGPCSFHEELGECWPDGEPTIAERIGMNDERKRDWVDEGFDTWEPCDGNCDPCTACRAELKDRLRAAHEENCLVDKRWRKAVENLWDGPALDAVLAEVERLKKEEDDGR